MEKKIAVLFPGIGYHTDKPLLYYSKKLARKRGYEIVEVKYGPLPSGVKGNAEKMRKAFEMALIYATEQLAEIDFAAYDAVLFIPKASEPLWQQLMQINLQFCPGRFIIRR